MVEHTCSPCTQEAEAGVARMGPAWAIRKEGKEGRKGSLGCPAYTRVYLWCPHEQLLSHTE